MNRIVIRFETKKDYHLEVRNDIKGYSSDIILEADGLEAKILFDLLTHIDYSKLDNYMSYGITVDGEDLR